MAVEDTTVRFMTSLDSGAPSIGYGAGLLITALDALLVNGYGSVTLASLAVASDIATATVAGGHGFNMRGSGTAAFGPVITIAGATPAGLNGNWRIREILSSTQFTFETSGISDQTATGTITAKMASMGWTKPYSGTNLAAYRMGGGSQRYLRVDDSNAYDARVVGYDAMTGISTGTEPFPTEAQQSGGLYMAKRYTTSGTVPWWIAGTDKFFYIGIGYNAQGNYAISNFGDLLPLNPSDTWCTIIGASHQTYANYNYYANPWNRTSSATNKVFAVRSYTGIGTALEQMFFANCLGTAAGYSGNLGIIDYPNPVDGALVLSGPAYLGAYGVTGYLRARAPGAGWVNNYVTEEEIQAYADLYYFKVPDASGGAFAGKKMVMFQLIGGASATEGAGVLDPVGPWA